MASITQITLPDGNTYEIGGKAQITDVTSTSNGLMLATDKVKLDGITEEATDAEVKTMIDSLF